MTQQTEQVLYLLRSDEFKAVKIGITSDLAQRVLTWFNNYRQPDEWDNSLIEESEYE